MLPQFPKKWSIITQAGDLCGDSLQNILSQRSPSVTPLISLNSFRLKIIVFLLPITVFAEQYKVTKKGEGIMRKGVTNNVKRSHSLLRS